MLPVKVLLKFNTQNDRRQSPNLINALISWRHVGDAKTQPNEHEDNQGHWRRKAVG